MVAYKGGVGDEVGRYLRTEGATHLPTDSYAAPIRPRVSRARHRHTGAHYSQPRMTRSTPLAFYQLKSGPSPPRPSRRRPAVHPQSPISLLLAARISSHTRTRLPPPLRQLSRPAPRTSPHTFPRLFRPCVSAPSARPPGCPRPCATCIHPLPHTHAHAPTSESPAPPQPRAGCTAGPATPPPPPPPPPYRALGPGRPAPRAGARPAPRAAPTAPPAARRRRRRPIRRWRRRRCCWRTRSAGQGERRWWWCLCVSVFGGGVGGWGVTAGLGGEAAATTEPASGSAAGRGGDLGHRRMRTVRRKQARRQARRQALRPQQPSRPFSFIRHHD